jgi:hypothetical protein
MRALPTPESAPSNCFLQARRRMMQSTTNHPETEMRNFPSLPRDQQGRVGYILLWLLGVPIPVLFLLYLLRGCT